MNNKNLIPIVCIVSVLIMIIWGLLAHSFAHAWLAVFAGGIVIVSLGIIKGNGGFSLKCLPGIISMVSVFLMFVWAFIEGSFEHAWLIVCAGGIISLCIHLYDKGRQ